MKEAILSSNTNVPLSKRKYGKQTNSKFCSSISLELSRYHQEDEETLSEIEVPIDNFSVESLLLMRKTLSKRKYKHPLGTVDRRRLKVLYKAKATMTKGTMSI